ncbi:HTTM domain-containing protein [Kordiimonas marina]|uniref:HTTM domain-containing protein n=1 Tax=Kordiimonas marina TaxID=2872312 RepID=UPI001FF1F875|nr:HTTM domain-containing protein [Kordiimonas marina]MCJ9427867.1 HTTM domain-containing protein [Kordiimonas marina]
MQENAVKSSLMARLSARLFAPVDGASLAAFRILFGLILMVEVGRYVGHHWIETKYIEPQFFFSYLGFGWVKPFGAQGMFWVFRLLGIFAFLMLVGLYYRLAAWGVFVTFSYIFLLDKAQYLNHFYFTILLAFVLAVSPANQVWSLDRLLGRVKRRDHIPAWALYTARAQMEIMLIWAGLVKLNADWLAGKPLGDWLTGVAWRFPHEIAELLKSPEIAVTAAWGVVALHLIGAPLLLVRRTRLYVFAVYATFHMLNHLFWQIGIFPWMTIAGTLLFFGADWPRQVAARLKLRGFGRTGADVPSFTPKRRVTAFVLFWVISQALLPIRPYLYPGNPAWNEQGHRFAWRMKLRDKEGRIRFTVRDPATGTRYPITLSDYLTRRQAVTMSTRPSMMLQFAHYLARRFREDHGIQHPQVFAESYVSLNGRPYHRYVDPALDLAAEPRTFLSPDEWILPLPEGARGAPDEGEGDTPDRNTDHDGADDDEG